jgi:hypothetical protein
MAASEDEAEAVILHRSRFLGNAGVGLWSKHGHLDDQFLSASLASEAVDRSIAGGGRDPAAGVGRQAVARPRAQRDRERLLDCVLGEVDVAEGADQSGDRSTGLLAEDPADRRVVEPGDGVDVVQSLRPLRRV